MSDGDAKRGPSGASGEGGVPERSIDAPRAGTGRRWFLLLVLAAAGCRSLWRRTDDVPEQDPTEESGPLAPVKKAEEEVVVAAWSEPTHLPEGGGITQILVRLQKRGGKPYPGVEVRLQASRGTLYSHGRILVTDARGMTRDRLTTRKSAKITLNAGGTRYAFDVLVAPDEAAR